MRTSLFVCISVLTAAPLLAQTPVAAPVAVEPQPPGSGAPSDLPPPGGAPAPTGAQPAPNQALVVPPVAAKLDKKPSVLRVNVTNQPWDFMRPWGKRPPYSRRAVGAVLPGNRVLVTGELVANANYLELEAADGGLKVPASIEVVDYEANLAILKADDPKFMEGFEPMEFTSASVGDTVSIWQLENTGTVLVTNGSLTTAEVSRYPIDDSPLLVYRATASLQFRDSSFTLPVVKENKLAGIIMRYDNATKSAEIVPSPVIEHFLKDAAKPPYRGFARIGLSFSNTRDPQLRRYIGLKAGGTVGGVYVTDVLKDGPSDRAGIESGDVILKIDGEAVDQDGNYSDPAYGKLSIMHLIGTRHFAGDTLKFSILRKGEVKELEVRIARRAPESYAIEPYVIDKAPRFYVLGGLVLQELSRQFLKEWGADWVKKAPEEFVFMDRQQGDLF
ncbi:MAG: hypothetical protein JWL90_4373, partial [Chthoniobacteraceae bacterium]|nr:hypothetical protein [Chthoniobacteraceae bacterium]